MKILHVNNIADISWTFSRAQRKMGLQSDVLVFSLSPYGFQGDFMFSQNPIVSRFLFLKFLNFFLDYSIYHFHFGSFLPHFSDIPLWKLIDKKVFVHYHGSDIRGRRRFLPKFFVNRLFVSTPDLLEFAQEAVWVPNPVILENFPFVGCKTNNRSIKIVHAPSSRMRKGSRDIMKAVKELRRSGYDVELVLIEKVPHKLALEYYKQADIAIDQVKIGWYGMFAIECMALENLFVYTLEKIWNHICPLSQYLILRLRILLGTFVCWQKITIFVLS